MHAEWNCDYLTKNGILDPWASINYVTEKAESVKLRKEKLEQVADKISVKIINGCLETAFMRPSGLHVYNDVKLPLKDAVDRWCFICAMSFSFWSDFVPGEMKYMIKSPDGLLWKGTRALMARFNQLIKCGIPLNATAFETMPRSVFDFFMRVRRNALPPMMAERYEVVSEVAKILTEKFDGSFYNCVEKANNDPMQLMSLVLENFPCFRDVAIYKGQKVSFLLKAQLLILGVSVLLEEYSGSAALDCSNYFILSTNHRNGNCSRMANQPKLRCGHLRASLTTEIVNDKLEKAEEATRVDCLDIDSFMDMDRIWTVAKIQRGQILFPRTRNIFY
ncbi:hypothetical protein M514_04956 [Trichuris suis]|uniref:Queuosine 5'-phosphate N-glycosylase/hydrolase n=1 Tax=Trichuris suis TaxID=68888 RepID=A0A085NP01_9BILA|nr:hypothetical protein M513_04956 [Trichuris suis]KFD71197.1 hypothetical protein M514_04956 [Trichuris suis]